MSDKTELKTKSDLFKEAYKCVNDIDENIKKEYLSFVKKFPVLIAKNGLISTLLFIAKKRENNNAYTKIGLQISKYLSNNESDLNVLIDRLINEYNTTEIMYLTKKSIDFTSCLKEVAEALLEE